ncbi:MAG: cytochrome c biogenesis protein CcsA [Acidimicrobiia bacterium]
MSEDRSERLQATGTRGTRILGITALVALAWVVVFGLFLSPEDEVQGEAVRFLYLHVPSVMCAYLGFGLCALGSIMFLRRRTLGWDRVAGASAELGVVFMAITLVTGSLWGKKTWGIYWTWDARLTTSALLFLMFLGYLAIRGLEASPEAGAKRSAIVGIIAAANIPIVNRSVSWWRSLHQGSTFARTNVEMDGLMLFTTFLGTAAFVLVFAWMLIHRLRTMELMLLADQNQLDAAIALRSAEGAGA